MFWLLFHPGFREAYNEAQDMSEWNDSFNSGAKKACRLFHQNLDLKNYRKVEFLTTPAMPYYFMKAYLERELTVTGVIDVERGIVIERNSDEALEIFVKHIRMLDTQENPIHLAEMVHCFHAGTAMSLVLEHEDKQWRAELNPPVLNKNEDGSVSLVYDLIHTGRSVKVVQCTLFVSPDYQVSLQCMDKN